MIKVNIPPNEINKRFLKHFNIKVIPNLLKNNDGSENDINTIGKLRDRFMELFNSGRLHPGFIEDGINLGYFSSKGNLTLSGVSVMLGELNTK
ncbi:hypothetical protein [Morganella morganii]|uniref:hypothetical protein n=1 Tax=Morganella morganii TaxID=582 RepID=UPI0030FE31D3